MPVILLTPFSPSNNNILLFFINLFALPLLNVRLVVKSDIKSIKAPTVIISNHQHLIDVFIATKLLPPNTLAVGKKEIIYIPIFGLFFWLAGNLLINRKTKVKALKSLTKIAKILNKKNLSIWVMPEGTRNYQKKLLPFKKGAFKTAKLANYSITPVVFSQFSQQFSYLKLTPLTIEVQILPQITAQQVETMSVEELRQVSFAQMSTHLS